jgi:hypothetical protein
VLGLDLGLGLGLESMILEETVTFSIEMLMILILRC